MTENPHIRTLITKARHDLKIARDEMETEAPVYDMIAFHQQQFIEKYLKAYLLHKGSVPRRTHNITFLFGECLSVDARFSCFENDDILFEAEDAAVSVRYEEVVAIDRVFVEALFDVVYKMKSFIEKEVGYTEETANGGTP